MTDIYKNLIKEGNELENQISELEVKLQNLSRGTIFIRKMGNSFFVYRKYKEKGKTKTIYLGNKKSIEAKAGIAEAKEYVYLSSKIKETKQAFNNIIKAIKAYNHKKTNFINNSIKINFELSKTMNNLINKAENADTLNNYGLYMNYAYAIDSQAKKETTQHIISEGQWNKLCMRYVV